MRLMAILAATLAVWAASAATATADVKVRYFKGRPTLVSFKPGSVIQVAVPKAGRDKRVAIGLVAFNRTDRPLSLGYENITVRAAVSGLPARTLDYDTLERKAQNKANWTMFFAALAAGANSYAAQQSAYGTYHGSAYTSTRYGGVSSTYSARYYSPVAAQLGQARANAENRDMFAAVSAQLDQTLAQLDGTVLRTTTIDPGSAFGGAVVFDLPKGAGLADLVVSVSYAGEVHEIPLGGDLSKLDQASSADLDGTIARPAGPVDSHAPVPDPSGSPERTPPPAVAKGEQPQRAALTAQIAMTPPSRPAKSAAPVSAAVAPEKAASAACSRYALKVISDPTQNVCLNQWNGPRNYK